MTNKDSQANKAKSNVEHLWDCLLMAEISEEKKKGQRWQHHNLWPIFFFHASRPDRTPKRLVAVIRVYNLASFSNLAWRHMIIQTYIWGQSALQCHPWKVYRSESQNRTQCFFKEVLSMYMIPELHLMQPMLNTAEDSKDIMLNVLKFPIAWWLYDPVHKNNTEPFNESGGKRTNWVHIRDSIVF